MNKKTKIVATIGPASSDYPILKELIKGGVNVIRLNMSHGPYDEQMEKVENIRKIDAELGTHTAILMDTKGPEVRTGLFEEKKALLEKGNTVIITTEDIVGNADRFSVSYEGMANDLKVGDTILLDDGYVSVVVKEIKGNDLICDILNTGYMKDRRGVNVPGVTLNFEFMSPKDRADIEWACDNDMEYIAASFVRNAKDLQEIKDVIASKGNTRIQIISKIESQDGVENFDEILELTDGVMVARGDLGVEVPAEEVPVVQKMIIKKCNAVGKPVITATQMLESMQSNPRPTRAEVSDVFNAVLDGTDAVMLSGESAGGDYPLEAVVTQATIVKRAEETYDYDSYTREIHRTLEPTTAKLIAFSAISTADKLEKVKLIITPTETGATPRTVSQMKPLTPVLALSPDAAVCRSLAVGYGVITAVCERSETIEVLIADSVSKAKELGLVVAGDYVVVTCGTPSTEGATNLVNVVEVK